MSSIYLLDTNAAVAILNKRVTIESLITPFDRIYLPITAAGELLFGAENSKRVQANIENVERLIESCPIWHTDLDTAREYGRIEFMLRSKGRSIPQNDVWIAAIARQNNFILLTRDAHFSEVDGLTIQTW